MKKTFTANIAGTVFHIEEDAYEALKRYLENIRANFSGSAAANEIMSDVEARIAELFTERLQGRNVVMMDDVAHVQSIMGKPEDFGGDEASATSAASDLGDGNTPLPRRHKRFFRDMEDNWVGGVIAGFSNYIGTDPLWVRIAFLILFFLTNFFPLLLIYILMWVLVPAANTAAEKLEMRGEPVTVDNIKKVFDEGSEKMKQGGKRMANEAEEWGRKQSGEFKPRAQAFASGFERFVRGLFNVFAKIVGGFAILIAALLAFVLVAMMAGRTSYVFDGDDFHVTDVTALARDFFIEPWMVNWGWIGATVCLLIPVIALMLGGMRLLFGVKVPKMFAWVLTPIWIMAVGLVTFIAIRGANQVSHGERVTEEVTFAGPAQGVMHLSAMNDPYFGNDRERYNEDFELIEIADDEIRYGFAQLDVRSSPDSLFHLEVRRTARGYSLKDATQRARAIRTNYSRVDSSLSIAPYYTVPRDQKLRFQEVRYILLVPVGASVRFERSSGRILYGVANTTNTWDGEMVGRTWTMTPEGLAPGDGAKPTVQPVSEGPAEPPAPKKHKEHIRISEASLPAEQASATRIPSVFGALQKLVRI